MLPILRIIPVGGVTLAITILILALSPPGDLRPTLARTMMPARGALIARADHPEWRQLLINAALRRADELSQLRELPDTPLHSEISAPEKPDAEISMPEKSKLEISEPEIPNAENAKAAHEVAVVPASRNDAEPEDLTGAIAQSPDAVMPVGIGEASSTELPVIQGEEKPPVIRTPERTGPQHEGLGVNPESAKLSQEQESVRAAVEPNNPTEDNAKAAPEPAKPAQESNKAELVPVAPARESRRRVHHKRYARAAEQLPPPLNFNLLEAFFASFNLDPRTGKPRRP
jgi:hypothetical protein